MSVALLTLGVPAFVLSLALTLTAERVATRLGIVARPAADRWHRMPVPLLGGVGIAVATVLGVLVGSGASPALRVVAVASLAMAAVGLVDDLRVLGPRLKLLLQITVAAALLCSGLALHVTGVPLVDVLITLLWIVGITNAFNLLDNMDGLAATIAMVTAGFRLLFFAWDGEGDGVNASVVFMGALAGFLVRNFPPAKVFMGDTGSLFVGCFLAGLPLTTADRAYSRGIVAVLIVPVLLFLIPLFDTAFVTVTRVLAGRSIAAGGRDHTSHRLVAIGWSERRTVLLMAASSVGAGTIAVLSYRMEFWQALAVLALLVVALVTLGVYLSRIRTAIPPGRPEGADASDHGLT